MARRSQDKTIPLDIARGKKKRLTLKEARQHVLNYRQETKDPFLLPVKLPLPEEDSLLANVPRNTLGLEYVLEMRRCFPDGYFIDDTHRSCRIARIETLGLHGVEGRCRALVHKHARGPSFPLLKVPISSLRSERCVEAANIIADPLGYDVFWSLITHFRDSSAALFHTTDFGQLPVSAIDHKALWGYNFAD